MAIKILYCGVCHSDIHAVNNDWGNSIYPIVPGHEITGVVSEIGSNVTKFKIGDRVGVGCFVDSCAHCEGRDLETEQYQPGLVMTYNTLVDGESEPTYGGYSESIVVKEAYVLSIPDALPLDATAPLLCAGITMYSPLKKWKVGPASRVAIIGMGGLGHIGVKISKALGAHVTILSRTLDKKMDGLRLGADEYFATSDSKTFELLHGRFDLIISTIAEPIEWNSYMALLKIDGVMVLVGAPTTPVPVSAFSLIPQRKILTGSMIGSIKETQEMLEFCADHSIVSEIELIRMEQVNQAYERILTSDVRYRFVIDLATL